MIAEPIGMNAGGVAQLTPPSNAVGCARDCPFGAAMAAVGRDIAASIAEGSMREPRSRSATLGALVRHLDEVGRHRVEADTLSEHIGRSWATGIDEQTLAVAMHRQASALASYNLNVMWSAKLIGVTAGALRQLVTAA